MSTAPTSRSSLRALRIAVFTLLGLVLGWLLLANLALWTGLVERAVTGDRVRSSLRLQHGFAWCVWPTKVHFSDLELAVDTHAWQLELEIPEGELDLNLWELPFRRFHADSIEGYAVHATFRTKLDPAQDDPSRAENYAPSDRLSEPLIEGEAPAPAAPEDAWVIALDSVDIDLDRLWVNDVRADVRGTVSGGFYTLAGHVLTVYPTYIDIEDGSVAVRDEPAFEGLVGALRLQLLDYSPQSLKGRAVLRQLFANVSLAADVIDLDWLDASMKDGPVTLGGGGGRIELDAGLAAGTLLPNSTARYETSSISAVIRPGAEQGSIRARAAVRLAAEVHRGDAGPVTQLRVTLRDATAQAPGAQAPGAQAPGAQAPRAQASGAQAADGKAWLEMPRFTAEVGFDRADLLDGGWSVNQAELDVPRVDVRDLGKLERIGKWKVRAGKLRGSIHGRTYESGRIGGSVEIDARGLSVVTGKGTPIGGHVELETSWWTKRGFDTIAGEITRGKLEGLAIGKSSDEIRTWVRIDEGRFAWRGKAERFEFESSGALEDLRAVLAQRNDQRAWVELVPDQNLTAPLEFEFEGSVATGGKPRTDLRITELRRPSLSIAGRFVKEGERTRAAFVFERARLGFTKDGDEWSVSGGANRAWLDQRWAWVGSL